MLMAGGVDTQDVVAESGTHAINSPADWWSVVLGSGYRGTIEQLDPEARERVRQTNLKYVQDTQVRSVDGVCHRQEAVEATRLPNKSSDLVVRVIEYTNGRFIVDFRV